SGLEISTAINNNLNILIIVVNNSSYGTIRMHQEKHYPKRVIGTNIKNPDFVSLSKSMGAKAVKVENKKEFF
ncbi:MAG: thiamine pyrophosphate-dependent enzyme, partial [Paracoccaceae bacterium]